MQRRLEQPAKRKSQTCASLRAQVLERPRALKNIPNPCDCQNAWILGRRELGKIKNQLPRPKGTRLPNQTNCLYFKIISFQLLTPRRIILYHKVIRAVGKQVHLSSAYFRGVFSPYKSAPILISLINLKDEEYILRLISMPFW